MSENLSLQEIKPLLRRRKWHFLIPAAVILAAACAFAFLLPPVYLSTATILIEQQEIPSDLVATTVTGYAQERIQIVKSKVMTRDNLWQIAEKFDLYPEERSLENQQDVIDQMREDTDVEMLSTDATDPRTGKPIVASTSFTISYENQSPETAHNVTQRLAELFLDENRSSRKEDARETSEFLATEAQRLNEKVSSIEAKLADFKKANAIYLPDSRQSPRSLLDAALQQRDELAAKVSALEGSRGYINNRLSGYGLAGQLAKARTDLAAAREKYSDIHPDVIQLKRTVDVLQIQLDQAKRSGAGDMYSPTSSSAEYNEYKGLQADLQQVTSDLTANRMQLADINRKIVDYEARLAKSPEVERAYSALTRDLDNATKSYQEISDKLTSAQLAEQLEGQQKSERFTLIEQASYPTSPAKPNRLAIILLGMTFALGSGVGIAAAAEYMDNRILGPKEFAAVFKAPPLAMIPEISNNVSGRV